MPDQAPNIDSFSGKGRLVYDKERRTIVSAPVEITVPLCESFRAIGIDISEEQLREFEKALFERGLNVSPRIVR
jgi:hypothetical protein